MMTIQDMLDLSKTIAAPLFAGKTYPWEVLADIGDFILQLGPTLSAEEYEQRGENIWIARDAKIFDSAYIAGPCIIDHGAELRQCAFVRGNAIVGKNAVVGNSCELKTSSCSTTSRRRILTMSAIPSSATRPIWRGLHHVERQE